MTGRLKVLYFGTPKFAADLLEAIAGTFEIVGIVTRPDARKGRGMKLFPSDVAQVGEKLGIKKIFKPSSLKKEPEFIESLPSFDCAVVASYGLLIPPHVLATTEHFVNVHASLLPEYRGAAPIERAIMDGKSVTGISLMKMEEGLDTGGYWVQGECPITDFTTTEELSQELMTTAAHLLLEYLPRIVSGEVPLTEQGDDFTYAKKIKREEQILDWQQDARRLVRLVNAIGGVAVLATSAPLKILMAEATEVGSAEKLGAFDRYSVKCGKGFLVPKLVQPHGKKPMPFKDFLNGYKGEFSFKVN